ncbi:MAG: tetratricopeptide repeat protein [Flavobacteriales bacterium]|nr:tetratricopeptide repeat protein [Flavobacteriales bacterium]
MKNQTHISLPTLAEIKSYNEGILDASRTHEIEILALENPLVADALEGFQTTPAYAAVPDASHYPSSSGYSLWKIGGWTLGMVGAGALAFVIMQGNHEEGASETDMPPKVETVETPQVVVADNTAKPTLDTVSVNTPPHKMTLSETNTSPLVSKPQSADQYGNVEESAPGQIEIITSQTNVDIAGRARYEPELIQLPEPTTASETVIIKHIQNYKVVDYGSMRHSAWPPFDIEDIGTPANYESPNNKTMDEMEVAKAVPYLDYMKHCIEAFYKGNFNRCLEHFRVVLKQYPDDANAQFYSGMCYFKKKDYSRAIASFDKSLANQTQTFSEEGLFYKAVSLKHLGKSKEACVIFTLIKNSSSFYKQNAAKEYDSCIQMN